MIKEIEFCGEVNGHQFVHDCVSRGSPSEALKKDYDHARSCDDCMTGIRAALTEYRTGNPSFDYKTFQRVIHEL